MVKSSPKKKRISPWTNELSGMDYAIGFSSLAPFLGLLIGLIALFLGILQFKKGGWQLILLAFLGYGVTFGIFHYYDRQRSPNFQTQPASGFSTSASAASGPITWRTPAEGLAESKRTHKPILYDITAEWCGPCHMLISQVFENPECAARINQLFVPVRVMDRAREEGQNPKDIGDIEAKYQLTGFPTLVVQFPEKRDSQKLVGFYGKDGTMQFLNQSFQAN